MLSPIEINKNVVYYQMDPIEPVSEENSDKVERVERDRETWTVREKRVETHHPFLVCLLKWYRL